MFVGNSAMRLILLLLALVASPVWAEWSLTGDTDTFNNYSDSTTIRRAGNFVRMWVLRDYKSTQTSTDSRGYLSSILQNEYDCIQEKTRLLAWSYYSGKMGTGIVISNGNTVGEMRPIVPRSIGETDWRTACGRSSGASVGATPSSNADFDLVNKAGESILFLYVSPVSATSWGQDKLGEGVVVTPGNKLRIRLPQGDECKYDVRVGYKDQRFEYRANQNLCELSEIAFNGSSIQVAPTSNAPQTRVPSSTSPAAASQSFGTGFFISSQGLALTNNHVTSSCRSITAILDGRKYPAQMVRSDERNDLALIRVQTTTPVPFASFRSAPAIRAGEGIVVAGFPLPSVLQNGLNITLGNVSALAGLGGNTAFLQLTAPVQPGNSGGPLLDMGGNIVGVVVSKLDAARIAQVTGDIPQNINFAVQGIMARLFLEAGGQRVEERSSSKELRVGDVGDRARSFTFQIQCGQ